MSYDKKISKIVCQCDCRNLKNSIKIPLKCVCNGLVPVVQSMVSLTSLLRGQVLNCCTTLLQNTLIHLQCKSFSYFSTKNIGLSEILTFEILMKR